jgi:tRNA-dihydrouridine synthase B
VNIQPLKIGNLTIETPLILAPMAGYTDLVLRSLCRRFGCGLTFTEITNAEGIVRGQRPTLHILETAPDEYPVAAHIYGSNPDVMAKAAADVEKLGRFHMIDINCGCPVRKIIAKGAGVALMKSPEKIGAIVRAVKQAVSFPVTVKTRLGLSPNRVNISEVAQAVEEAGGSAIFIHVRFASAKHAGDAAWDILAKIKSERTIPVVGNGGITIPEDVPRMFSETGVDGVMIGRAAIGHPWIFRDASCLLTEHPLPRLSLVERRAVVAEHLAEFVKLKDIERKWKRKSARVTSEELAVRHFTGHLIAYLRGCKSQGEWKRNLQSLHTIADVMSVVDTVLT